MTELDIVIKLLVVHLSLHVWRQSKQLCYKWSKASDYCYCKSHKTKSL